MVISPSVRIVEICRPKHFHPPVHLVEVGGEDIPISRYRSWSSVAASSLLCARIFRAVRSRALVRVRISSWPFLTHPLRPLPVPVKGVQKRAEGGEGFLLVEPTVLTDGQEGEVLWAVLFIERSRCKLPPRILSQSARNRFRKSLFRVSDSVHSRVSVAPVT